jgi:hypothetical protein
MPLSFFTFCTFSTSSSSLLNQEEGTLQHGDNIRLILEAISGY